MPLSPQQLYDSFLEITQELNRRSIIPTLYGSLAIWLLTGDCPSGVEDADILVPENFIGGKWPTIVEVSKTCGYTQDSRYPHEFWKGGVRISWDSLQKVELLSDLSLSSLEMKQDKGAKFFVPSATQLLRIYQNSLAARVINGKLEKDILRIDHLVQFILKSNNGDE